MIFGLLAATILARGPVLKAIGMILIGLLLGTVGTDLSTGASRMTFGAVELFDGIDFIVIAIGLFGFSEIIENLEKSGASGVKVAKITRLWPTREDFKRAWPAAQITILARNGPMGEPFKRMPEVDEVLFTGVGLKALLRSIRWAWQRRPDVYLIPFPSNRWHYSLLALTSRAKTKVLHS